MMIRRTLAVLATAAALVLVGAGPAMAANPHYLSGPTFSLEGSTVTATGSVAGLGNENVDVVLTLEASVTVQCENPAGKIAPGQTKFFEASTTQSNLHVDWTGKPELAPFAELAVPLPYFAILVGCWLIYYDSERALHYAHGSRSF